MADLEFLLEVPNDKVYRLALADGMAFRLRCFGQVDDPDDGWTAEIVEMLSPTDDWSCRLYPPGSGLVFRSSEVRSISSDAVSEGRRSP